MNLKYIFPLFFLSACYTDANIDKLQISKIHHDPISLSPITYSIKSDDLSGKIHYVCYSNNYFVDAASAEKEQLSQITKELFPNAVEIDKIEDADIKISLDTYDSSTDGDWTGREEGARWNSIRISFKSVLTGSVEISEKSKEKKTFDVSGIASATKYKASCWSVKNLAIQSAENAVEKISRDYLSKIISIYK